MILRHDAKKYDLKLANSLENKGGKTTQKNLEDQVETYVYVDREIKKPWKRGGGEIGKRKWGFLRRRGKGAEPLPRKYRFAKPGGRTRREANRPRPGQESVRAPRPERRWYHDF
jgi:hypothetical protein